MSRYASSTSSNSTYSQSRRYRVKKEPKVEERDDWSSSEECCDTGYGSSAGSYVSSVKSTPLKQPPRSRSSASNTPVRKPKLEDLRYILHEPHHPSPPPAYPVYPTKSSWGKEKASHVADWAPTGPQMYDKKIQKDGVLELMREVEELETMLFETEELQLETMKAKDKAERRVAKRDAKIRERDATIKERDAEIVKLRKLLKEAKLERQQRDCTTPPQQQSQARLSNPAKYQRVPPVVPQAFYAKQEASDTASVYSEYGGSTFSTYLATSRPGASLPEAYQGLRFVMPPFEAVAAARAGNFEVVCRTKSETPISPSSSVMSTMSTLAHTPPHSTASFSRLTSHKFPAPRVKIEKKDLDRSSYSSSHDNSTSPMSAPARRAESSTRVIPQHVWVPQVKTGPERSKTPSYSSSRDVSASRIHASAVIAGPSTRMTLPNNYVPQVRMEKYDSKTSSSSSSHVTSNSRMPALTANASSLTRMTLQKVPTLRPAKMEEEDLESVYESAKSHISSAASTPLMSGFSTPMLLNRSCSSSCRLSQDISRQECSTPRINGSSRMLLRDPLAELSEHMANVERRLSQQLYVP